MRASPSSADKIHHAPRRADVLADESAAVMAMEQHRPRITNSSSASTLRVLEERMIRDNLLSSRQTKPATIVAAVCACVCLQPAITGSRGVGALSSACKAACVMVVEFWQTGM